jgi:RimJ/RimL family protein N-acetyltransferase
MVPAIPELPPPLPEAVLAQLARLPQKPDPVELAGRTVTLRPLDVDRDATVLYQRTNGQPATLGNRHVDAYDADALVWRFMSAGPFAAETEFRAYLEGLRTMPDGLAFTVFEVEADSPVGIACYLANVPLHGKIELGSISYSPLAQGTLANREASYLMLRHAFDLGYCRLEWKCNALNERSRRAALRIGFQFEGVQDAHYIIKGRRRDTAWFRMLASEWPDVRAGLEARLHSEP